MDYTDLPFMTRSRRHPLSGTADAASSLMMKLGDTPPRKRPPEVPRLVMRVEPLPILSEPASSSLMMMVKLHGREKINVINK